MKKQGFTLVEMMVATALMSVVLLAGTLVFLGAQSIWSLTYTQIQLQDNLRQGLQRISGELQESGRDSNGLLQVVVYDNTGLNATDMLKFAVPLCLCGTSAITSSGTVKNWGAPLIWGRSGCDGTYTLNGAGKVDICHVPPGNPNNTQSLSVNASSVKAHLAHGDWLGQCNACSPTTYTNRWIQYKTNAAGQLLREILDSNNATIASVVVADDVANFQTNFIVGKDSMTMTLTVVKKTLVNRTLTVSGSIDVILRNGS
jgi:prepilin-type N-terminal cleavage/methylation domain-containing protein